jgi:hypothetical protein
MTPFPQLLALFPVPEGGIVRMPGYLPITRCAKLIRHVAEGGVVEAWKTHDTPFAQGA